MPHFKTSTLSFSSLPSGTDSCGKLGIDKDFASISASNSARATSAALISSPIADMRAMISDASPPDFLI